jgi:hypothetical protein
LKRKATNIKKVILPGGCMTLSEEMVQINSGTKQIYRVA